MKCFKTYLLVGIFLIFCSSVWADIPKQINFQGILKDSVGNPYPDGNYSITFRIYDAAGGGNILWQEGQLIAISGGLFTHLLGSAISIPESVFNDSLRWLGIQVAGNPEITPRSQLVSVPYSYVADFAQNADKLDGQDSSFFAKAVHTHVITSADIQNGTIVNADISGTANIAPTKILGTAWTATTDTAGSGLNADLLDGLNSTDFLNTATDFGRSGVATDLYEGAATLASKYVNVTGPDSVISTSGSAFLGKSTGSGAPPFIGIDGIGTNTLGGAFGGRFNATSSGVGNPIGVDGTGSSSTSNSAYGGYFRASGGGTTFITGVVGLTNSSSSNQTIASYGQASNSSTGTAYGGYFQALSGGTGSHIGVYGVGYSASSATTYGSYGLADNTSTGQAYGGFFATSSSGAAAHFGVYGDGRGSSSTPAYGSYGFAENTSTGQAVGGHFQASPTGTGTHYGVWGSELAGGGGAAVYAAGDFAGSGAKYAVAKTSQGHRLLSVIESPEVWFEDFGEGQLINGNAHIELDPLFLETITINSSNPMKVFIQLNDPNCNGVAVIKGTTGFDVIELQNGTNNASFDFRILAKRKGYENQRLKATDVGMDDPNLYPELWQEIEKRQEEAKIDRNIENK